MAQFEGKEEDITKDMSGADVCDLALLVHQYEFQGVPALACEITRRPIDKIAYETLVAIKAWDRLDFETKWRYLSTCRAPVDYIEADVMDPLLENLSAYTLEKIVIWRRLNNYDWLVLGRPIMYIDGMAEKVAIAMSNTRRDSILMRAVNSAIVHGTFVDPHPNIARLAAAMVYMEMDYEGLDSDSLGVSKALREAHDRKI